ncbi:hypothetical protein [Peterkaempfera griseoplana]|uniref:hypothetical protein n=1 Tax=Peterkaempfera griseoplana TaxID=66896 RepID=UPI000AF88952|nr:hypothetical protein [Peterkaempfera griseoplana]
MRESRHLPKFVVVPLLAVALLVSGCSGSDKSTTGSAAHPAAAGSPSPTSSAEKVKHAKAKFVVDAGLAAGATYQWIYKPFKAGKFKKGASGRKTALVKAGLAGAFTYNRLKAALTAAKGDPTLAKAIVPLTAGVAALQHSITKMRDGSDPEAGASEFQGVIDSVKDAGKSAGADVTNQVPSLGELKSGG